MKPISKQLMAFFSILVSPTLLFLWGFVEKRQPASSRGMQTESSAILSQHAEFENGLYSLQEIESTRKFILPDLESLQLRLETLKDWGTVHKRLDSLNSVLHYFSKEKKSASLLVKEAGDFHKTHQCEEALSVFKAAKDRLEVEKNVEEYIKLKIRLSQSAMQCALEVDDKEAFQEFMEYSKKGKIAENILEKQSLDYAIDKSFLEEHPSFPDKLLSALSENNLHYFEAELVQKGLLYHLEVPDRLFAESCFMHNNLKYFFRWPIPMSGASPPTKEQCLALVELCKQVWVQVIIDDLSNIQ